MVLLQNHFDTHNLQKKISGGAQCRVFDFTWPNLVIFLKFQETMSKCFENFLYLYRNVTGGHFVLL